jgi:hypothetical protein
MCFSIQYFLSFRIKQRACYNKRVIRGNQVSNRTMRLLTQHEIIVLNGMQHATQ